MDATNKPVRQESCGFLVDCVLLFDAGSIGVQLTMPEQHRIRLVLLNHLHFDQIKRLPLLADNLAEGFDNPVLVAATEPVIQGLMEHVFNDRSIRIFSIT